MPESCSTQSKIIRAILKDSNYHPTLFLDDEIDALREKVFTKTTRGKETPFVNCIVREKEIQLRGCLKANLLIFGIS